MKRLWLYVFCVAVLLSGCAVSNNEIPMRVDLAALGPMDGSAYAGGAVCDALPERASEDEISIDAIRVSAVTGERQMRIPENLSSAFQLQLQQTTVCIPERSTVEAEIDSTLTARMADTEAEVQNVLEIVEEELNAGGQLIGSSNVYSYYATDTITRLDDIAFSLITYHSSFTGGAHPNNRQTAINFSLKNGEAVCLSDVLLPHGETVLEGMILDWLQEKASDFGLFEGYSSVVTDKFGKAGLAQQDDAWYFSQSGLVVFFNPYDITPHAAGVVKLEFTYDTLDGILQPDYFPSVTPNQGSGSVAAGMVDELSEELYGSFSTVEYVEAVPGEKTYVLFGAQDAPLFDVALNVVSWIGDQAVTQRTIYAANYLSAENLVCITVSAPEDVQNLMLQYDPGNGKQKTIYFSANEEIIYYQSD